MADIIISLIFIFIGLYGTLFYKKASKETIEKRKKINKNLFGKQLKVSKRAEVFNEYFSLIISVIFLIIGILNLIRLLMK